MLETEPEDRSRRKRPARQLYVPPAQRKTFVKDTNDIRNQAKHKIIPSKKHEKVTQQIGIHKTEKNSEINKHEEPIDYLYDNRSIFEFLLCNYLTQLKWKCSISGTFLNFKANCDFKHHQEEIQKVILQIPLIFFYSYSLYKEQCINYNKYFCINAFPFYSIKKDLQYTHYNQAFEKVPLIINNFHNSYSDVLKQFHIFCDYDIYKIENNLFIDNSYKYFPCLHIMLECIQIEKQNCCIFDIFDNISDTSNSKNNLLNKDNASASENTPVNKNLGINVSSNISDGTQNTATEKTLRIKITQKKTDHEEEVEIMRKTKEHINRKTRPIMKYVGESNDTLNIGDDSIKSWEDLFDEEGEIKEELLAVEKLHKATANNKQIKDNNELASEDIKHVEELEHMVELYDFPSTFRTQDLIQAFSNINCEAMYIKWVDDTHAILVLGTLTQAMKASSMHNPLIKVRPMATASRTTLAVAHKSDLKPAMKRPATNLQAARRFITAALGTKIGISKEQMAKEREDLKMAREMKKMLRKNEKDAWEGNLQSSLQ